MSCQKNRARDGQSRTGHSRDGFLSRKIGYVHESVVKGRVDVRDTEHELTFGHLGTEGDSGFLFDDFSLLWRLDRAVS